MYLKNPPKNWINDLSGHSKNANSKNLLDRIEGPSNFIPLISACQNIEDLQVITASLRDYFGFDIATFGQLAIKEKQAAGYILASDESPWSKALQWIDYYKKNIFAHDPALTWGQERSTPIIINDIHKKNNLTPYTTSMLNAMVDFNVSQSILIPVRASAQHHFVVRLTSLGQKTMTERDLNHHLPLITLICLHLSEAFSRLFTAPAMAEKPPKLTKKELMILGLVAEGKNTNQMAGILNISENTILFHMKNIHKKLNVQTRQHAITKALSLGLINL